MTACDADGANSQNRLEFELRLQQFIELVRNRQPIEARHHAQRYLSQHANTYLEEVKRAAGLLAYPPDTQVPEYRVSGDTVVAMTWLLTGTRKCIPRVGGMTSPNSSSIHTTNSSRSPHDHSST